MGEGTKEAILIETPEKLFHKMKRNICLNFCSGLFQFQKDLFCNVLSFEIIYSFCRHCFIKPMKSILTEPCAITL